MGSPRSSAARTFWPSRTFWSRASGGLGELAVPDWLRADVDRRLLIHVEGRARRAASRPRRRALAAARGWSGFAAVCLPVAAVETSWGWALAAGLGASRAGLSWRDAYRAAAVEDPGLALPSATAPAPTALIRSSAAAPLRRGESALTALAAAVRALPPGPVADQGRAAMASAAAAIDVLRGQAAGVLACEAAARAGPDRDRRAEAAGRAAALVAEMSAGAAGLELLLGAAGELVAAAGQPAPADRLASQTENLRGMAAALRDLAWPS